MTFSNNLNKLSILANFQSERIVGCIFMELYNMGLVAIMDNCPPFDGVVVSWTIVHEIRYFSFFMKNCKI